MSFEIAQMLPEDHIQTMLIEDYNIANVSELLHTSTTLRYKGDCLRFRAKRGS